MFPTNGSKLEVNGRISKGNQWKPRETKGTCGCRKLYLSDPAVNETGATPGVHVDPRNPL